MLSSKEWVLIFTEGLENIVQSLKRGAFARLNQDRSLNQNFLPLWLDFYVCFFSLKKKSYLEFNYQNIQCLYKGVSDYFFFDTKSFLPLALAQLLAK